MLVSAIEKNAETSSSMKRASSCAQSGMCSKAAVGVADPRSVPDATAGTAARGLREAEARRAAEQHTGDYPYCGAPCLPLTSPQHGGSAGLQSVR
ncbi:hypothetical protein GCM10023089_04660 [Quisquiliibacterium transsilvanicum]